MLDRVTNVRILGFHAELEEKVVPTVGIGDSSPGRGGLALAGFLASDAMNADRSAEGTRDPPEVVGIARDDDITAGKGTGDDGCVDDVASTRPRARGAGGASAMFVEVLDSAAA